MKVLFPFVGDTVGGSHISASLLIRGLRKHEVEPIVVIHREGPLVNWFLRRGIEARVEPRLPVYDGADPRTLFSLLSGLLLMVRLLRHHGVEIVHVNDGKMIVTWALAAHLAGAGFVVHQRQPFTPSRVYRWAVSLSDGIIAISCWVSRTLPRRLQGRAIVIGNPFEFPSGCYDRHGSAHELFVRELGFPSGTRLVVFVANFAVRKRPLIFVEMAARIAERYPNTVSFVMAGTSNGTLGEVVRERIELLGIKDRVLLPGFVDDVGRLLTAADMLVAPAVDEAFGRTLVEAMALGTPVVASASAGHCEIIEDSHNGLLFPPDDVCALTRAVLTILESPRLARRLADGGREVAQQRFSVGMHVGKVVEFYRAMARRN